MQALSTIYIQHYSLINVYTFGEIASKRIVQMKVFYSTIPVLD